ncbi:MAG: retropepsin-like aspartic protease [Gemmatimonadaceae bacterium]
MTLSRIFPRLPVIGLAVALATLTACGPAKPVLIFAPPTVTLDSSGAPRRSAAIKSVSTNFWEAMANLDTGYALRHEVDPSEREFAAALGLVMSGHHEVAALRLDELRQTADDNTVISASRLLLTAMLQHQGKWKRLAELDSMGRLNSGVDGTLDKAGVEQWSNAFSRLSPRTVSFPNEPVVVPLELSAAGTPMIRVRINGRERTVWLDTGSSMSIVSESLAALSGVAPLLPDTLEVATATGRVPARAGSISLLEIGGIRITHTPTLIVDDARLELRVGDGQGAPIGVRIDGVIGYDLISQTDLRIDYVNGRVVMARPDTAAPALRTGRNLFWIGTPIVRLITNSGIPLHFNLDTGAQESYSTDALLSKTKPRTFVGERRLVGGLAGISIIHGRFVDELRATMAGQPVLMRKLLIFAPAFSSFVSLDGILGSDVGKNAVVRIDATNGIYRLEQPTRRGLRISR